LRRACEASLRRLKVETIELYQLHRVDPQVPLADSLGALIDLRAAGKLKLIGLSNVSLEQLRAAEKLTPSASVQNRYNLLERGDDAVVDYCHQRNIAYLSYSPLAATPFEREAKLAIPTSDAISRIAARHHAKPSQIALAWLLYRAPNIIPIPGTTSSEHLRENYQTLQLRLSEEDVRELQGV
jgi:aryl-alcohol dehydrogenase-like predicted oxidoreductase